MRSFVCSAACCAALSLALVACNVKPKQVGDPSSESGPKTDEPSTKWEPAAPPEDSKPKTSGGGGTGHGAPTEAPPRRNDVYDKEATEVVLKRAARQVKENCGAAKDDTGKAVGPWGKAMLQIQLGHSGRSKGVTVPAPFQGKPSGNCVEKAFSSLTYPPWGGADTEVSWEVELINPTATATPEKK